MTSLRERLTCAALTGLCSQDEGNGDRASTLAVKIADRTIAALGKVPEPLEAQEIARRTWLAAADECDAEAWKIESNPLNQVPAPRALWGTRDAFRIIANTDPLGAIGEVKGEAPVVNEEALCIARRLVARNGYATSDQMRDLAIAYLDLADPEKP